MIETTSAKRITRSIKFLQEFPHWQNIAARTLGAFTVAELLRGSYLVKPRNFLDDQLNEKFVSTNRPENVKRTLEQEMDAFMHMSINGFPMHEPLKRFQHYLVEQIKDSEDLANFVFNNQRTLNFVTDEVKHFVYSGTIVSAVQQGTSNSLSANPGIVWQNIAIGATDFCFSNYKDSLVHPCP